MATRLRASDIDVDVEWATFDRCVENMFSITYEDLFRISAINIEQEIKRMQSFLAMRARKGGQGNHVLRSVQQNG